MRVPSGDGADGTFLISHTGSELGTGENAAASEQENRLFIPAIQTEVLICF